MITGRQIRYYRSVLYFLYNRDGIEAMLDFKLIEPSIKESIRNCIIADKDSPLSESDKVYYAMINL